MNQKILFFLATLLLSGMFIILLVAPSGAPPSAEPTGAPDEAAHTSTPGNATGTEDLSVEGLLSDIAPSAQVFTLIGSAGQVVSVELGAGSKIFDEHGQLARLSYLRKGFILRAFGAYALPDSFIAEEVRVVRAPNILVYEPRPNDEVGLPLIIRGEARVFESSFTYRVKDKDGSVLVEASGMAASPDAGQFGPFEVRTSYPQPGFSEGTLEVFEYSAKDGSEVNGVSVPIRFKKVDAIVVKVYFRNRDQGKDCSQVTAVDRRIERTLTPARRAIEELLAGPRGAEILAGQTTAINSGATVRSVTIQNGVARADFDSMLEAGVGGSCRVQAIRAQIAATLKQFAGVETVIVSVNGRTEDALQP